MRTTYKVISIRCSWAPGLFIAGLLLWSAPDLWPVERFCAEVPSLPDGQDLESDGLLDGFAPTDVPVPNVGMGASWVLLPLLRCPLANDITPCAGYRQRRTEILASNPPTGPPSQSCL